MTEKNDVRIQQNAKEIDLLRHNVTELMAAKVRFEGEIKALIIVMREVKDTIKHLDDTIRDQTPEKRGSAWQVVIAAVIGGIFTFITTVYTGLIDLIVKVK